MARRRRDEAGPATGGGPRRGRRTRPPAAGARERILGAALQTFAERGYEGTTTRELARRARVNLGLIPYYFRSKEGLWKATVDRVFGALREELGGVVLGSDVDRAGIERIVRAYVGFVARNPAFVRLMHEEGKRDSPRMRWLVERHVRPLYEATSTLLGRARSRRIVPPIPDAHFHYILVGAAGLFFGQAPECRRLTGEDPTSAAAAEAHADAVVAVLLGDPPEG